MLRLLALASLSILLPTAVREEAFRCEVELLEPGAEPRRPLRYTASSSASRVVRFRQDELHNSLRDGEPTLGELRIRSSGSCRLESEPTDGGTARLAFTNFCAQILLNDEEPGEPTEEELAEAERLARLRLTLTHDDRGARTLADAWSPEEIDSMDRSAVEVLEIALRSLPVTLPEEPVGVGAKWSVKVPYMHPRLIGSEVRTYELVEASAERFVVTMAVEITLPAQRYSVLVGGRKSFKMESGTCTGTGRFELRADSPFPERANVEFVEFTKVKTIVGVHDTTRKLGWTVGPPEEAEGDSDEGGK